MRKSRFVRNCALRSQPLVGALALSLFFALPLLGQIPEPRIFTATTYHTNGGLQLNIYVAVPLSWLHEMKLDSAETLEVEFTLFSESGELQKRRNQSLPIRIAGMVLPAVLRESSTSFVLPPGKYELRVRLKNGKKIIWSSAQVSLQLEKSHTPLDLSDLTPVPQPRFGLPPFASIAWPELANAGEDFYLYYEIKTTKPDTFITMFATLRDGNARVVHQEQYRIYLSDSTRNDFLRVKTEELVAGRYQLELRAGALDSPVRKTYSFEIQRPISATVGTGRTTTAWMRKS